ncbi:hypothetical protein EJC51_19040 [Streptomyces aquilus]|uniref:Uncharacterized protein n=1 Tax=Streptomyces aquilus TaxID=2548456 RepID=A0A3S9I0X8_9ACTN|nr:hypothetical protein EJC51_19040 [Streptomyces aquilus]
MTLRQLAGWTSGGGTGFPGGARIPEVGGRGAGGVGGAVHRGRWGGRGGSAGAPGRPGLFSGVGWTRSWASGSGGCVPSP